MTSPLHHRRPRSGFTLIEIAFSIALVSGVVLTLMAFFPMGIKTQNQARYKILAATKAMEMMEWYRDGGMGGFLTDGLQLDKEGIMPWDTIMTYRAMAPDLEVANMNMRGGLKPLPREIAYRLDSDNDEIRTILDQGGHIFYCAPTYLTGFLDGQINDSDKNWLSENRKLLIGVVGYPQQNSILYHPSVKVGPYQEYYPSPPTYAHETTCKYSHEDPRHGRRQANFLNLDAMCRDKDVAEVMWSTDQGYTWKDPAITDTAVMPTPHYYGYKAYLDYADLNRDATRIDATRVERARAAAKGYVIAAKWYCVRPGIDLADSLIDSLASEADIEAFARAHSGPLDWRKVLAMRYLAHAAATLTRHYTVGELTAGVDCATHPATYGMPAVNTGIAAWTPMQGVTGGIITLDRIKAWHEVSLRMAIYHAETPEGPYNWGAPRALNRQVMMDHPLCQLDLWSQPISASIPAVGGGTNLQRQWRAVYPQRIHFPGLPYSYPGRHGWRWGGSSHLPMDDRPPVDHRDAPINDNGHIDAGPRKLDVGSQPDSDLGTADMEEDGWLDENDRPVPSSPSGESINPAMGIHQTVPGNWQPALGPSRHFNLTRPFEPFHRCRQIVVWAVDWQSYEDFETAPSAPVDGSRYPTVAPHPTKRSTADTPWTNSWVQRTPLMRQADTYFRSGVLFSESLFNPEHTSLFRESVFDVVGTEQIRKKDPVITVSEVNDFGGGTDGPGGGINEVDPLTGESPQITQYGPGSTNPIWKAPESPTVSQNSKIFLGLYGANRNGVTSGTLTGLGADRNGSPPDPSRRYAAGWVDGGTVPKSIHLRASTVCRFNYYDGRASGFLRN